MFISIYLLAAGCAMMVLMAMNATANAKRNKLNKQLIALLLRRTVNLTKSRDLCFGLAKKLGAFSEDEIRRWYKLAAKEAEEAVLVDLLNPRRGEK